MHRFHFAREIELYLTHTYENIKKHKREISN